MENKRDFEDVLAQLLVKLRNVASDMYKVADKDNRGLTQKEQGRVSALFFCISEIRSAFYGNKREDKEDT